MEREQDEMSFKTPRPVPKFYSATTKETAFSTKREKSTPFVMSSVRAMAGKTAPAATRFYNHRFDAQKPTFLTYRSQSDSFLDIFPSHHHYDESCTETYFDQCFTIIEKIGEGSFGEVFSVRSKEDGCLYAIKRSMEGFRNEFDRSQKLTEVVKHQQLPKQANLVRLYRAWEERGRLYIQQELCKCSLADYSAQVGPLDERTLWNFFVDLLLAVKHLHEHDLIHLDIKPENIFISNDGICKLGDFGLVHDLQKQSADDAQEGDAKYMAPELLQRAPTKAADIFSLGMSMLELATDMDVPTRGPSWHVLRSNRLPDELINKAQLSAPLRHAIQSMLTADARLRPSADQLLRMSAVSQWTWCRESVFTIYLVVCTLFMFVWEYLIVRSFTCVLSQLPWHYTSNTRSSYAHGPGSVGGSASACGRTRRTPVGQASCTPQQNERLVMRLQFDEDNDENSDNSHNRMVYSPPASPHIQHHRSRVFSPSPLCVPVQQSPSHYTRQSQHVSPPPLSQSEFGAFQPHRLLMVADDTSDDSSDDMAMGKASTPSYRPQPMSPSQQPRVSTPAQKRTTNSNRMRQARTHDERMTRHKAKMMRHDHANQSLCAFGDQPELPSMMDLDTSADMRRSTRARPIHSSAHKGHKRVSDASGDSPRMFGHDAFANPAKQLSSMFEQQPGSSSADEL